jgi:DHA3 family tetracycline resistance protein-like MFS transporter
VPGPRKLNPISAYYLIAFGDAFLVTFADNVAILFQTDEAALSPFKLLVVSAVYRFVILVCEVPTGLVADTLGRRISVVTGLFLLGVGFIIAGALPEFGTIVLGEAVLGLGLTFISGAQQAWIADEVGIERANPVYLRTAQISMWLWVIAIPLSVLLSTVDVNSPILLGGSCLIALAAFLGLTMPEEGFVPRQREATHSMGALFRDMTSTYSAGLALVRVRPLLLTMFMITAFYGLAGLGFQRLWLVHFNENIGYPNLWGMGAVEWFGILRVAAALLSVAALEYVRRKYAEGMSSHRTVTRSLFIINALQFNSLLLLAIAGNFELAAFAYCMTFALSYAFDPFYLAWINQNVDSSVRATVISMNSQTDALGRTIGGPLIGLVGGLASVRAALVVSSLAMVGPLVLYLRAFRQGPQNESAPTRAEPQ